MISYGSFHKWGYPRMVGLQRKMHESINGWFGGTPIYGNLHMKHHRTSMGTATLVALVLFPAVVPRPWKLARHQCSGFPTPGVIKGCQTIGSPARTERIRRVLLTILKKKKTCSHLFWGIQTVVDGFCHNGQYQTFRSGNLFEKKRRQRVKAGALAAKKRK